MINWFMTLLGKDKKIKVSNYFSKHNKKRRHPAVLSVVLFMMFYGILNFDAVSSLSNYYMANIFNTNKTLATAVLNSSTPNTRLIVAGEDNVITKIDELAKNIEIMPSTDRVVVERLNINAPIQFLSPEEEKVKDFSKLEENLQKKLEKGVVHYPGTALPGEEGNVFITGHSSYYPWNPGQYKDVFAILHAVELGDTINIYSKGQEFKYEVTDRQVVTPDRVDVLDQTIDKTLTLMTCTPIGTNAKRLIIKAKLVE